MCGQWGDFGVNKKFNREKIDSGLPLSRLRSLVDDLARFKPAITLFGGEPLLYKGCPELISYIKSRKMHCLMITTGYLLEDMAEEIVGSGLDELNVSLDGGDELHNYIRGMPGLFKKIIDGLIKVNHFKSISGKPRPLLNLQCTINRHNAAHLEQMLDVASSVKADSLTFHNLIFISRKMLKQQEACDAVLGCSSRNWEGFVFEPGIDPEALHNSITKILSAKHKISIDFYPNFSRQSLMGYYSKVDYTGQDYSSRCISPWAVAYIFPDGEVRPCLNSSYSYGDIFSNKFSELWNNGKALNFRCFLKKNRILPACARCTELYRY
jgi:MoaA/NifB/PqqE/SkfB family radical SAM enzyme